MANMYLECHSLISDLMWHIRRSRRKKLMEMGITPNYFYFLRSINPNERLTLSEISSRLKMENSNVTSIVNYFEEKGLLKRSRDDEDRRITRVCLTPEGEEYREKMLEGHNDFVMKMYEDFTSEEMEQIKKTIKLVLSKIK